MHPLGCGTAVLAARHTVAVTMYNSLTQGGMSSPHTLDLQLSPFIL